MARFAAFDFLGRVEADILFLQETRLPNLAAVHKARREWRSGPSYWSLAAEPYSGVAVLFTAAVECRRVIELEIGRCLILDVLMKGQELRLINIYGPQTKRDRKDLFMRIKPYLFTSRQVIFGGDFNAVTRTRDRGGSLGKLTYDSVALNSIASEARLVDVHIRHTPGHAGFTYYRGECRSRIDRFYLKEEAISSPVSVVEVEFSDHCLILFSLNVAETPRMGRGLWRLNSSLLEEAEIRQSFEDFLQSQRALRGVSFPSAAVKLGFLVPDRESATHIPGMTGGKSADYPRKYWLQLPITNAEPSPGEKPPVRADRSTGSIWTFRYW
ncbi:uncharacterized protein [Eleutherodactylus coqui]|uniref:uncharacterized protein n=1 Tax=Eleutherodactylus coqui TaxID=57060 RepID=UPI003461BC15